MILSCELRRPSCTTYLHKCSTQQIYSLEASTVSMTDFIGYTWFNHFGWLVCCVLEVAFLCIQFLEVGTVVSNEQKIIKNKICKTRSRIISAHCVRARVLELRWVSVTLFMRIFVCRLIDLSRVTLSLKHSDSCFQIFISLLIHFRSGSVSLLKRREYKSRGFFLPAQNIIISGWSRWATAELIQVFPKYGN